MNFIRNFRIPGAKPVFIITVFAAVLGGLSDAARATSATISYVQGNYGTPQSSQTSVQVTFNGAQAAGDLNVVVVGWNDTTAVVSSVTDTSRDTYALAVGPTIHSSATEPFTQSIYYAKNIAAAAAGANSVTVTFSTAAASPDIRILEYKGADPNNPVDVTAASSGSSSTSSSGSATTTNPTDLIFGANIVWTHTTGPGSGFTQRLLSSPDGDIAEDEMVTQTGSYSVTAPLGASGAWVMQMVAFRTPSGGTTPPTYLLTASPTSLAFGAVVIGSCSTLPVILAATGSGPVTISQVSVMGPGLTASGLSLPYSLSPGQNTDLSITFCPITGAGVTGSVSVVSNASNSPAVVSLSGTGQQPPRYVVLSWSASTSPGVTGYNVFRSNVSGGPYIQVNTSLVVATSYTDNSSALQAGTTYYYVTTAVNSTGIQSGYSNQAAATIPSN